MEPLLKTNRPQILSSDSQSALQSKASPSTSQSAPKQSDEQVVEKAAEQSAEKAAEQVVDVPKTEPETVPKTEPGQMPEAPAEPPRSRSRSRQRIDSRNMRSSSAMRELFHDVLEKPSRSVVEIYADGKRVCLGTIVSKTGYIVTKASLAKGDLTCRLSESKANTATNRESSDRVSAKD